MAFDKNHSFRDFRVSRFSIVPKHQACKMVHFLEIILLDQASLG